MDPEVKQKLIKVYELVQRGGTDGEKAAAQNALDRLLVKFNLDPSILDNLDKENYHFTYTTEMEKQLIIHIAVIIAGVNVQWMYSYTVKSICASLTYLQCVTITCAYEYFRKHMKAQWNKFCLPVVKRCRTSKTRNAKRKQLQTAFFNQYVIKSKLYEGELVQLDVTKMSKKDFDARMQVMGVQGGKYHEQMGNGLLLEG